MASTAKEELERNIFGGSDSELSEDDHHVNKFRDRKISPRPAGTSSGSEDNYGGEAGAGGKSRRKKAGKGDADGSKLPKKRKKKRRDSERDQPEADLDPEQQRKLESTSKIDGFYKTQKQRPKKRKKQDAEDILDRFADEEVVRLRDEMNLAADTDMAANADKRPATAKLRMLPEVMDMLQKQALQQSIFDNNLLLGVRRWLEPLPDKSLPALNIQNAFFEVLPKMDIDTNTLKESGLGKIVLFYTRCKRVTPGIKRSAEYLVDVWSRPIIKRSASYRDRQIPTMDISQSQQKPPKLSQILAKAREEDATRVRKNAVRVPERDLGTYSIAPKASMSSGPAAGAALAELEKRRAAADRLRKMQRKLALNKQKNSRL